MTKKLTAILALLGLVTAGACITVNVYFPASAVEKTADNIVKDVYKKGESNQTEQQSSLLRAVAGLLAPQPAHAGPQKVKSVSNAAIRGLKAEIRKHHEQLVPFYKGGHVGITNDGLLAVRDTSGLPLPKVAKLKRLVQADNQARKQLYRKVAEALDVDPQHMDQERRIFADKWRENAQAGWWIQKDDGTWVRK
jgi:uncharacterized protein YdbL (DUF1318 family)